MLRRLDVLRFFRDLLRQQLLQRDLLRWRLQRALVHVYEYAYGQSLRIISAIVGIVVSKNVVVDVKQERLLAF